ncbi:putative reverse transcriptase domain-containing protein [Tanacetum coccineum]|uniref:Reverse transcriptase domain-containing protein n=1 Tax=Tanacetum coccineum TaxID=301880 RepID=A0ABQ5ERD1_9ASTR
MAISIISVSSDSSEDSVGTPARRVILFGTIPTTIPDTTLSMTSPTTHIDTTPIPIVSPNIPPSPDYTLASPDYSPVSHIESDLSEDPSSDHVPPLRATSLFLSSTDDSSDSDIHDTPPSPTHDTPFTKTTLSTQRSPAASGALRRRVMILLLGQPIPYGRPYRYHLNGPIHMITARKRVGPLPTHHLAKRHSVDFYSLDHFSSDDSSSSSSSKTSSDSPVDALCDSASSCSSSDHSLPISSSGTRSSHRLCSLVPSVHRSPTAISERPSYDSSSASPSRKSSRSLVESVPLSLPIPEALSSARADLLPSPKRIRSPKSAMDFEGCLEDSFELYVPREAGLGVNVESSDGPDINPEIQAEINECVAYADSLRVREIDARVVVEAVDREEIEISARGLVEVRVDRVIHPVIANDIPEPAQEGAVKVTYETLGDLVQRIVATGQQSADMFDRIRELEQDNRRLRDIVDVTSQRVTRSQRRNTMPNTRSGASRTHEGVNEQIDRRLAGALGARGTAKNLEPLIRDEGEQEEVSRNRGNGNGNGNGGGYGYNFKGFFEKMETVFHISNYPEKYQVKYAMCTLLNGALTWWNSQKRTFGIEAAYVMSWAELMKLMTEVYCPRNEIQKIENELWNLAVKGNDLTAYTKRFQELVLLCTRMVLNEEEKVERFIGGLPDNIQGNVIIAEPTRLQDAIRIANNLMDEKLKGYARSAENKRRLENNPRDNHEQQPIFKRQNVRGQNIARAYTAANNERKGYDGSLHYCNKCKLHHVGPCTVRCGNCKRVGHMTRDCKVTVTPNTQRAPNRRNKTRNKTKNQTGGNEATARAYIIGGGGANPDSNVAMGTFLLNSCYASMLFDSGADRSFVSSTFSALLDVT